MSTQRTGIVGEATLTKESCIMAGISECVDELENAVGHIRRDLTDKAEIIFGPVSPEVDPSPIEAAGMFQELRNRIRRCTENLANLNNQEVSQL